MKIPAGKVFANALKAVMFAAAFCIVSSPGHAQSGPFAGLAGNWLGEGRIEVSNGPSERIRCRAGYLVTDAGRGMQQALRCASDSYKFDVNSNVTSEGDSLSGTWSELTRNLSGRVSGTVSRGHVQARIDGGIFTAGLTMAMSSTLQSVTILPDNSEVRNFSVTLRRH